MSINPFIHDGAPNLDRKLIADIFVDDFNYTRLIRSRRNVFLLGERGSGKSMALLFNSVEVQKYKDNNLDYVGIYVPCNTVLHHKEEAVFFKKAHAIALSEHYLSLSMAQALVLSLKNHFTPDAGYDEKGLLEDYSYIVAADEIRFIDSFFESLNMFFERESNLSQQWVNESDEDGLYKNSFTFFTLVFPLIKLIRKIPGLEKAHFMFLMDDAHSLSEHEKIILNSYIAYRDNSSFSFKVAIANDEEHIFHTAQGGTILDGHDFTKIDLEQDFQSKDSSFGRMASKIIRRRLELAGLEENDPDNFFPMSKDFSRDIEAYKVEVRKEAELKYDEPKKIADYVYKYARAHYFKDRASKANIPPYSGFNTIAHVSTGVIRNLLIPCADMYDDAVSKHGEGIDSIDSTIQRKVLIRMSDDMWEQIKKGYSTIITNCTQEDSDRLNNLLNGLAELFKFRLLNHKSEPRVLAFTISAMKNDYYEPIQRVLSVARKAQLIYTRIGPAKDDGKREIYYVPNRLLWISRSLDPNGQHGRISLQAMNILSVMNGGSFIKEQADAPIEQGSLLDG